MTADLPTFDELVDLLRERLGMADALNLSEFHSFKKLMAHEAEANLIADNWYWQAFEELEANGHLNPASHKSDGLRCTCSTLG